MSGDDKTNLTLVVQPEEFFHELVTQACKSRKVTPKPETEFYLVKLLGQFMNSENLYVRDADGRPKEEPLAFMIKDALDQTQIENQRLLFRHLGDVSLYTAGFFQDSLMRKLVDIDYYIGIGGAAYRRVATAHNEAGPRAVFSELADKFGRFVDVLAEVGDQTIPKNEQNLLRIYDLWTRTRSERAAKALQEAGMLPQNTSSVTKKAQ